MHRPLSTAPVPLGRRPRAALIVAATCAVVCCALLARPAAAPPDPPQVTTLDGRRVPLLTEGTSAATVLVFTLTDCPISNRYAPELKRLHERFAPSGVRFVLVYSNPADDAGAIRAHLSRFGYRMEAVRDPSHAAVAFTQATVAPEAVVFDRAGRQLYRGRIDNRFASIGVDRQTATTHDLEDAIDAALAGRRIVTPITQAVGCILSDTQMDADDADGHKPQMTLMTQITTGPQMTQTTQIAR